MRTPFGLRWLAVAVATCAVPAPGVAQTVDAALEIEEGALASYSADFEVAIVTGPAASLQDVKWYVAGACSNEPTAKVAIKSGLSAVLADKKVGIVASRFAADKVICVTNADRLSSELKELLGLAVHPGY